MLKIVIVVNVVIIQTLIIRSIRRLFVIGNIRRLLIIDLCWNESGCINVSRVNSLSGNGIGNGFCVIGDTRLSYRCNNRLPPRLVISSHNHFNENIIFIFHSCFNSFYSTTTLTIDTVIRSFHGKISSYTFIAIQSHRTRANMN